MGAGGDVRDTRGEKDESVCEGLGKVLILVYLWDILGIFKGDYYELSDGEGSQANT